MLTTSVAQSVRRSRILVVEDEPTVRKVCEAVLCMHGFECILATDGQEGLDLYRQREQEIRLVLSDISMPVKSGIQMFREILHSFAHANVILMSGYGTTDVVPEDLLKLCSLLGKPFTASTLIASVKKCLD